MGIKHSSDGYLEEPEQKVCCQAALMCLIHHDDTAEEARGVVGSTPERFLFYL